MGCSTMCPTDEITSLLLCIMITTKGVGIEQLFVREAANGYRKLRLGHLREGRGVRLG